MSALFALTTLAANAAPLNPQPPGQQHAPTQQNPVHFNNPNLGGMNQGSSQFHPVSLPVMAPGANRHEQLPPDVSDFRKEPSHLPNAPVGPKPPEPIHLPLPAPIHTADPIRKPVDPIRTPEPTHSHGPVRAPEPTKTFEPIHHPEPVRTPEPIHSHGPVRAPEPQKTPDHGDQGKNHGDQGKNADKNQDQNQGDHDKN